MGDINSLKEKIEHIEKNPLFYLFLSSQELFHSNFWYWLSKVDKEKTLKVFKTDNNAAIIAREKRFENKLNEDKILAVVDLVIMDDKKPITIIENKIKDYPTSEQLDRIRASVKNIDEVKFLLITLIPMEKVPRGWAQLTYSDLAKRMKEVNYNLENEFEQQLIQNYIKFIEELSGIVEILPKNQNYDFITEYNKELFKLLESIKLDILYKKWRASHFKNYLSENLQLSNKTYIDNYKDKIYPYIQFENTINRKKATITVKIVLKEQNEFGIQIEGNQYRKFILLEKREKEKVELFKKENLWFSSDFRSSKEKEQLQYKINGGESYFYYQYENLDREIVSFEKLKVKIENDFEFILENLEKLKVIINRNK